MKQVANGLITFKNSEKVLSALIKAIPNPAFFRNTDGVFIDCNKAFADTIIVPIVIDSLFDVTEFDLALDFDETQANLINVNNSSNLAGLNINPTSGRIAFDFNANNPINVVSDTLAILTFVQMGC